MAITLSSSDPANGAQDVYINKNITLVFNKALTLSKVTSNIFILTDVVRNQTFPTSASLDSTNAARVKITLYNTLKENTAYRVMVVGSADAVGTDYLTATDDDSLTTSIIIEFTTGDQAYSVDSQVQKESQSLTLEGDLSLPQNIKALGEDFVISYVRPKNYVYNTSTGLTGDRTVRFKFNKSLSGGQDYTTWADVEVYPLLDDTNYLSISGTLKATNTGGDYSLPAGTASINDTEFVITFDKNFPNNTAISINLTDQIRSSSGDYYGGSMKYLINTQVYPDISGPHMVKRELNSGSLQLTDTYVTALIFKNCIWLWERLGRGWSLSDPPSAAKKFVIYSAILDIIEDQEYARFLVAGTRRQLGDLNISVDSLIGRLAMKASHLQKEKELMLKSLLGNWEFKTVIRSDGQAWPGLDRLWHGVEGRFSAAEMKFIQPDIPSANLQSQRSAKVLGYPNNAYF